MPAQSASVPLPGVEFQPTRLFKKGLLMYHFQPLFEFRRPKAITSGFFSAEKLIFLFWQALVALNAVDEDVVGGDAQALIVTGASALPVEQLLVVLKLYICSQAKLDFSSQGVVKGWLSVLSGFWNTSLTFFKAIRSN
ncbi:Hypothetical predicted protein [Cloeon dipterum]|uniref:Uncharacterized protein n=1 Tax=Cloeon dipterum TaxID=197152 RepID=A0A8S1DT84_9INSE|nr:Hypothetical predicted protein [Cloeon dipterum]